MKLIEWKSCRRGNRFERMMSAKQWKKKKKKKTSRILLGKNCAHYNVNMQWNHHSPFAI